MVRIRNYDAHFYTVSWDLVACNIFLKILSWSHKQLYVSDKNENVRCQTLTPIF